METLRELFRGLTEEVTVGQVRQLLVGTGGNHPRIPRKVLEEFFKDPGKVLPEKERLLYYAKIEGVSPNCGDLFVPNDQWQCVGEPKVELVCGRGKSIGSILTHLHDTSKSLPGNLAALLRVASQTERVIGEDWELYAPGALHVWTLGQFISSFEALKLGRLYLEDTKLLENIRMFTVKFVGGKTTLDLTPLAPKEWVNTNFVVC